jgi:hypothetical protein
MRKAFIPLVFAAAAALSAFARPGGWATINVDPRPDSVAVGQPLHLAFMVKQHGVTPLAGLKPRITLRSAGQDTIRVMAKEATETGRYYADVSFPAAGEWSINIHSGFMRSETDLPRIRVVSAQNVVSKTKP